ncbi:hypothetical protein [Dankookia sp. P2]|uniref:hypothetical protein n=1 Tax=Dankookia sp. P2 TaxID=3423955 RepID=UPI003D66C938
MQPYILALIALSIAGVIEARCSTPGLRPEAAVADNVFHILGRAAFGFWLVLLAWGFWKMHWTQPAAGIVLSLGADWLLVQQGRGPTGRGCRWGWPCWGSC